jgi:Transglutaminase-like superfamily
MTLSKGAVPGRLARLGRLTVRDWYETIVVVLVAAVVEASVRSTRLPVLARRLGIRLADGEGGGAGQSGRYRPGVASRRLAAVERIMKRWPFGDTCLRRCLVTGQRVRKLAPVLHIGVTNGSSGITAHSWIEIDGRSLDPSSGQFLALQGAGCETSDRPDPAPVAERG